MPNIFDKLAAEALPPIGETGTDLVKADAPVRMAAGEIVEKIRSEQDSKYFSEAQIRKDVAQGGETYVKAEVDPSELKIRKGVKASEAVPEKGPIVVGEEGKVIDGNHRAALAKAEGEKIEAYVPATAEPKTPPKNVFEKLVFKKLARPETEGVESISPKPPTPVSQEQSGVGNELKRLGRRAKQLILDQPGATMERGLQQLRTPGERLRGVGNVALSTLQPFSGVSRIVFGDPAANVTRELGGGETAQEIAATTTEMVGGLGVSGTLAKVPGMASRVASEVVGFGKPKESIPAVKSMTPGYSGRWGAAVDRVGQTILSRVPKVFRSGRGTPLEFREARAQMETDVALGVEKALELGTPLKRDLSLAERLRADQVLRGSIITDKTPQNVVEAVTPIRAELDRLQKELLSLGKLSPESIKRFEGHFGPYLARLYAKKEFVQPEAVLPWKQPVRAGTPRLKVRGERVEVEIPSLEDEMKSVAKFIGPEKEFKDTFRDAARGMAKRKETVESESVTERILGEQRSTKTATATEGGPGEFSQIPLSGAVAKLEEIVTNALMTRGMTQGEASNAVGRLKAAVGKIAQAGEDVKITGGGTVKETTTETIRQTVEREKATVKTIIENLGVNKAQKAALHAYYDAITRAAMKTKKINVGEKAYKIKAVFDPDSAIERVDALDDFLKDGYTVESRQGNKVTLFRDIPETVRKEMGELRDQPGFVVGQSVAQLNREVAVNKFFNQIARNPEWTTDAARPGFTQMGDSKERLGELAGKFVRSDIAGELNEITRIRADWEKITSRLTQMWKVGKVMNPATMGRNMMSSAIMADWAGLSLVKPSGLRSYARAASGFLGRDEAGAALLAEAKAGGVFRSSFNQQELANLAEGFVRSKEENGVVRLIDGMREATSRIGEKVGHPTRFYGAIDSFFKGALYVHARSALGLSPRLAVRYAKKYGIDYGDISPAVRFLREFPLGAPFITFASKAVPLAIETAVKHPVRFWKWPLGLMGMSEMSSQAFQAERGDLDKATELGEVKAPRFVLLPDKDKDGRYQFLDLGYILPFGDLLESIDRLRGGGGSNLAFEIPGGPAKSLIEVSFNKNDFTAKPIYHETDTLREASSKITDHLLKSWLPAWAPPIPFTGFRGGHTTEALRKVLAPEVQLPGEEPISPTDYAGRRRSLGTTVASKMFGLNIKSVDPQEVERFKVQELERQVRELSAQIVLTQRSGITQEQKQAKLSQITEKLRGLIERARAQLAPASTTAAETSQEPPRKPKGNVFERMAAENQ